MTRDRSTWTQLASAILGVISVGAFGYAVLLLYAGLLGSDMLGGALGQTAAVAAVILAALAATYGAASAIGAVAVWQRRDWGPTIGLGVGAVAILGAVIARMSGGWHDALWAAIALGAGVIGALLLDRTAESGS